MNPPDLSVVIPCYNEAEGLPTLHQRVSAICRSTVSSYELIFVNDGSSDATWDRLQTLVTGDPHVIGVDLSRNHGHQLALTAGLSLARGNHILIIDADLQDPPELLPRMLEKMRQGYEVVYGKRSERQGESGFKRGTAYLFYRLLQSLSETKIPLDTGDFRLLSRKALDALLQMPERCRFIRGMVAWIGFPQTDIVYERAARQFGTTKYPLRKMVRFAFDAITSFSIRPLRLATYLGLLFGGIAGLGIVKTVWDYANGQTVRGWSSLMVVLLSASSAQLLVLGIMGEYLGRIFIESKQRPLFIISRISRSPEIPSRSS